MRIRNDDTHLFNERENIAKRALEDFFFHSVFSSRKVANNWGRGS